MDDTITAVSTPPGTGGIAVIRVSGRDAIDVVSRIWRGKDLNEVATHTLHLGTVLDTEGQPLDQGVAAVMRGPRSYTGQDTVELSVHGSPYIQRELLESLIKAGARLAAPGEYTRRAYAAGNLDLAQAEAVADTIAANSRAAHRLAINQMRGHFSDHLADLRRQLVDLASLLELELDFSEEDVEFADRVRLLDLAETLRDRITALHRTFRQGNAIKNGIPVAIIGPTNAGKSSLLNALVGEERAIVSDIHGTTRDTIEELITIGDYQYRLIDTAGLRDTDDPIEQAGIARSHRARTTADITLLLVDPTDPEQRLPEPAENPESIIAIINKTDIADDTRALQSRLKDLGYNHIVTLSARTGDGIDTLTGTLDHIVSERVKTDGTPDLLVTNARHAAALADALAPIGRVIDGLRDNLPGDLIAQDLRETIHALATITGDIPSSELLSTIFSRFCIGK
ncbi:MAG: tRNA uridine-5-carboxymethylaminomethyl(34) synthesis GTPase MnmE [Muribaculaceae bacterium]|nr:tRNA uridine-5-carboxymethylaminomethyl(34) synthesis GTPase MnmE [Muribaculaceae bacterium]